MWANLSPSLSAEGSLPLEIPGIVEKIWLMQNNNDYHGSDEKSLMFFSSGRVCNNYVALRLSEVIHFGWSTGLRRDFSLS